MKEHTAFNRLRRCLEDNRSKNPLPDGLSADGYTAMFLGHSAQLETFYVGVRESGPAAWGTLIPCDVLAYCSWDRGASWFRKDEDFPIYLTTVDSVLDLIYVDKDDQLKYVRYVAEDLDA